MARQKLNIISGATELELKTNVDEWLAVTEPIPVVNCFVLDLNNLRAMFIYSEQVPEITPV